MVIGMDVICWQGWPAGSCVLWSASLWLADGFDKLRGCNGNGDLWLMGQADWKSGAPKSGAPTSVLGEVGGRFYLGG
jgi:hypothetical protein